MPRVTRAAAKADPILADETETTAQTAVTENTDPSTLPSSPTKSPERKPLGETGGNPPAPTATSNGDPETEHSDTYTASEPIDVGKDENQVSIASVGKPAKADTLKAGKKSTRKGKGQAQSLRHQLGQQMDEWSQSLDAKPQSPNLLASKVSEKASMAKKSQRGKKGTGESTDIRSTDNVILEDAKRTPTSPASGEAAELLREDSPSGTIVLEDDKLALPSPAVEAAKAGASSAQGDLGEASTATKLAVVKEAPHVTSNDECQPVQHESAQKHEAVQKLKSLFEPEAAQDEETTSKSPLAEVVAHTPAVDGRATPSNPIEAMDALEEDIEAAEASIKAASKPSSPSKAAKPSGVDFADAGKPSPAKRSRPTVQQSSVKAPARPQPRVQREVKARPSVARAARPSSKPVTKSASKSSLESKSSSTSSQGVSDPSSKPNTAGRVRQRSAISALNTPPQAVKSNKPVTKSSFQLPGEAAAARLKAMKEEREKRREEAEQQKALELKNKPMAKPTIRPAAARPSISKPSRPSVASKEAIGPSTKRTSTVPPRTSTVRAPRPSTIVTKPTNNPFGPTTQSANDALDDYPKDPKERVSIVPRVARLSTAASAAKAPTRSQEANTIRPRVTSASTKGREVYNREKLAKAADEKAIKERIQAAKKAREDATLRGKAAAKAWAERKKVSGSKAPPENEGKGKEMKETGGDVKVKEVSEEDKENAAQVDGGEDGEMAAPVDEGGAVEASA